MAGRPRVEATTEEQEELRALARSSDREEADPARALLLSLADWSSFWITEAFTVKPDSVRQWRWIFGRKGVAGLRARKAPGLVPVKGPGGAHGGRDDVTARRRRAGNLDLAASAEGDRGANRRWDLEIAAQRGDAEKGALPGGSRGIRWKDARMPGCQDADAVVFRPPRHCAEVTDTGFGRRTPAV